MLVDKEMKSYGDSRKGIQYCPWITARTEPEALLDDCRICIFDIKQVEEQSYVHIFQTMLP